MSGRDNIWKLKLLTRCVMRTVHNAFLYIDFRRKPLAKFILYRFVVLVDDLWLSLNIHKITDIFALENKLNIFLLRGAMNILPYWFTIVCFLFKYHIYMPVISFCTTKMFQFSTLREVSNRNYKWLVDTCYIILLYFKDDWKISKTFQNNWNKLKVINVTENKNALYATAVWKCIVKKK